MQSFSRTACRLSVLVLALAAGACKDRRTPDQPDRPDRPGAPVFTGGLSTADRETFYHLAEGSEIAPANLVRALRSVVTGKPFLEQPERFGLIADPDNKLGLPVGATDDYTVDSRLLNVRMFGINCSACHVNEVSFKGTRIRVDGSQSRFYSDSLTKELAASIHNTTHSWRAFWQFAKDFWAIERGRDPAVSRREPGFMQAAARAETQRLVTKLDDADTTAAERAFVAEVQRALHDDSVSTPAVNMWDVPWDSTSPQHQQFKERYRDAGARTLATRVMQRLQPAHRAEMQAAAGAAGANAGAEPPAITSIRDLIIALRLLRDRVETLIHPGPPPPGTPTPAGVGRVDAFGAARNKIYPDDQVPLTAPVDFPHLWGLKNFGWYHYDANTNSVMERNLGQALGVGAIWDRRTYQSTLNPINLHVLEEIAYRLQPPAWPAAFPKINQARADSGRVVFENARCASCHQGGPAANLCYRLAEIGTDSLRPINFALPLGTGTFTSNVAPVLTRLKQQAYRTFRVPTSPIDSQAILNGIPDAQVVWRTTRMWGARPLAGVWATAPYLHNGSVPNLYELLSPPGSRRKQFPLGHTEYDPDSVGYTVTGPGLATFDATKPGNDNGGHPYGTNLSEPERLALLEYLKGYSGAGGQVPSNPAAVPCPSLAQ